MMMTAAEIVADYRQAKSPQKQINILADLNCCSKADIARILIEAGETVPKYYTKSKAAAPTAPEVVIEEETSPDESCQGITVEKLVEVLMLHLNATDGKKNLLVHADGRQIVSVHMAATYDAVTDEVEWYLDLLPY